MPIQQPPADDLVSHGGLPSGRKCAEGRRQVLQSSCWLYLSLKGNQVACFLLPGLYYEAPYPSVASFLCALESTGKLLQILMSKLYTLSIKWGGAPDNGQLPLAWETLLCISSQLQLH